MTYSNNFTNTIHGGTTLAIKTNLSHETLDYFVSEIIVGKINTITGRIINSTK